MLSSLRGLDPGQPTELLGPSRGQEAAGEGARKTKRSRRKGPCFSSALFCSMRPRRSSRSEGCWLQGRPQGRRKGGEHYIGELRSCQEQEPTTRSLGSGPRTFFEIRRVGGGDRADGDLFARGQRATRVGGLLSSWSFNTAARLRNEGASHGFLQPCQCSSRGRGGKEWNPFACRADPLLSHTEAECLAAARRPGPGPGSDPQKSPGERFFWPVQVAVQVGVARRQAHAMPDLPPPPPQHNSNAGAHSFRPSQASLLLRGWGWGWAGRVSEESVSQPPRPGRPGRNRNRVFRRISKQR